MSYAARPVSARAKPDSTCEVRSVSRWPILSESPYSPLSTASSLSSARIVCGLTRSPRTAADCAATSSESSGCHWM